MSAQRSKGSRPSRARKTGKKREQEAVELEEDDGIFASHAWRLSEVKDCCRKALKPCLVGVSLLSVNGMLLAGNLSMASEIREMPLPAAKEERMPTALPALRGYVLQPSTTAKAASALILQQADLDVRVAAALEMNAASFQSEIFETPAWSLPTRSLLPGQALPYKDMYRDVNSTHVEYKEFNNVFYLSPCTAQELARQAIPAGDPLLEKAVMLRTTCSDIEKARNLGSKRLVVYVHARESGFFGHAVDNILPRVAAILEGSKRAGLSVTLVLPKLGRMSLSPGTVSLCQALGLDLMHELPDEPHRTVGVQGIATWGRLPRRALQAAIRSSLLSDVEAAKCSRGPEGQCCAAGGLFLSRSRGVRNSRPVTGAEHLESALRRRGLEIVLDAAKVPLKELAQQIYQSCCLAGWTGSALANLLFLPPEASVVEFNPYNLYANWWQWSHALGLRYFQFSTTKVLTAEAGEYLAKQVFGEPVTLATNMSTTVNAGLSVL